MSIKQLRAAVLAVATIVVAAIVVAHGAAAQTAADIIDATADPEVESQLMGDFGSLSRDPSLPLGAIQKAWDSAPADAGTYRVAWSPDKVIRLRVREAIPLTIRLPQWEVAGDVTLGDGSLFEYQKTRPNILTVHAKYVGADAGMIVVGQSGNIYAFYLRAEGFNSENVPDLVAYIEAPAPNGARAQAPIAAPEQYAAVQLAAQMVDEGSKAIGSAPAAPSSKAGEGEGSGLMDPDYLTDIPFDPTKLRFDFTMSGDKSIAPERVFSDGLFTYFDWGDRWNATDLPAVYRVIDGVDTPQNVRYRGSMIVVETTGAFTLRNGQRFVCVRPAGWEPSHPDAAPAQPQTLADGRKQDPWRE